MAAILIGVLLFVVIFGSLFGADSRPQWRDVSRRPRFRSTGSMRPDDWPRDDRDR
jgi:tryptophan-rich sensory protein